MNDVLLPICRADGVNLVTGIGFLSISAVVGMLRRLAALPDDRPTRIGYVSDFDPAGDSMPTAVARQIEFWLGRFCPGRDVKLTPIALTRAQVIVHDLPRIPIKESDRRKANFEDRRGEGAVELDALEAVVPGELARMVREFIDPYRDHELESRMIDAAAEAQEEAENAWEEATRPIRDQLDRLRRQATEIVAAYRPELEALNARLAADLQPVRDELERVRHATEAAVDETVADLPDRPEAETEGADESEWLYDSARDYMEQLACYRAAKGEGGRQRRSARMEEFDLKCEFCGKAFRARKRRGKGVGAFCSKKCGMAAPSRLRGGL
jgi:hypothetical protein